MKQCTCYALRAIDCTCKPAKYGELYTSPTAKQEQGEPVAYLNPNDVCADTAFRWCKIDEFTQPVYTTPQPAQKPLTDEQIKKIWGIHDDDDDPTNIVYERDMVRAIEAAHGIKENT